MRIMFNNGSSKMEVTELIKIVNNCSYLSITLYFFSNFCVDYKEYDIFELWTLSGNIFFALN